MKIGLNSFQLKLIAVITMIIDHVGLFFFPEHILFRIIGRISFPIFAFLIVEGFYHTRDIWKYMIRLGVFAVLSEIPFDLLTTGKVLDLRHQNVFFTLLIGVILMYVYEKQYSTFSKVSTVFLIMLAGDVFRTDYGSWGVLMIFCFFIFRERMAAKLISVAVINIVVFGYIQAFAVMALLPIYFYNGEKGRSYKYFFYLVYPVHLWIIWIIKTII
ncbi:MAG: TraX family protein [Lachnospiraceae bacterium]|nr:TraX family protein [Lachnospiraceae bacterium]